MKIKGTNILVAGGTRGIGLSVARTLAGKGARLIIPWYDWPEESKAALDELSSTGRDHIFHRTDLRVHSEVRELTRIISEKCTRLHVLINNIERGGMPVVHGSYEREINRDQWQLEMDTTLLAKRLLFENCLPLLRKEKEAVVINISSIAGITGRSGPAGFIFSDGYAAANRAVASLTETWARQGAPSVRVNEIMLGLIDTRHGKGTRGWKTLTARQRRELVAHTLAGRTGRPAEVTKAVIFLIEGGSYITGATLRLDGGYILGGDGVVSMPAGII